jgi:hypothetical protein
LCDLMNIV